MLTKNQQILTKRFLTIRDAYVSGYFFSTIDNIPKDLLSFLRTRIQGNWSEELISEWFTSSAIEVSLPQETLKVVNFPAKSSFMQTSPLSAQLGNNITINFLVTQSLRITNILVGWIEYIKAITTGLYEVKVNKANSKNIYSCNFYYATLLPNMEEIVFAFVAEGFYPITNPINDFSQNISTYDVVKHNVTFNVDYYETWTRNDYKNVWIRDLIESKIKKYKEKSSKDNANQIRI